MSTIIQAYAAHEAGGELKPFEYTLGDLHPHEVEIDVKYCGICHSDLSMIDDEWDLSQYPLVPGHEVVGKIAALGSNVKHLQVGQTVGLGWYAESCMTCDQCMSGNHNLCANGIGTISGRHGGFAKKVRAHAGWTIPLPDGLDPVSAGPMFCGGITVFNPLIQNNTSPLHHVAVVGIGGLGHIALAFLRAWGCEVTAFSTTPDKEAEAKKLGAHHFVNSRDPDAMIKLAGQFDMILVTVNVELPWDQYIAMLKPKGKLYIVGAVPSVSASVFPLLIGQKSIGGSPVGSPYNIAEMLKFAARHQISPVIETFKLSAVNEAMAHLASGKARYRIVLEVD